MNQSINFILFLFLWPAAVFGALHNELTVLWLVLILMVVAVGFSGKDLTTDFKIVVSAILFGLVFESLAEFVGWMYFIDTQQINSWPPVWIIALWAGLGLTFRHSNVWLFKKNMIWMILWLALVPLSYLSAAKLGVVQIDSWQQMYPVVFIGWSIYLLAWRIVFSHKPKLLNLTRDRHA